jgi:hypothetical protein
MMNNHINSKIQNLTHLTPPMNIQCKFRQRFHGCSWDSVGLWCTKNLQQVLLNNTSTPRRFETNDEHHACNIPLSYTLQWDAEVPWWFNTQCTKGFQQIKTTSLEEEVLPLLTRASKQTSMLTPNNTSEALISSCMLKKHLIHHNEDLPSWRAQTRLLQQGIH